MLNKTIVQYHYRAHFSYTPDDDLYIPCHELGISFQVSIHSSIHPHQSIVQLPSNSLKYKMKFVVGIITLLP